jgi:hypothetical protein
MPLQNRLRKALRHGESGARLGGDNLPLLSITRRLLPVLYLRNALSNSQQH